MKFKTESGSVYEIDGRLDENQDTVAVVRRLNDDYTLRADGLWKRLLNDPVVRVGESVTLILEPLGEYGPDSYGKYSWWPTVRRTSRVVEVWA